MKTTQFLVKNIILFAGICGFVFLFCKRKKNCGVCIMQIIESGCKKKVLPVTEKKQKKNIKNLLIKIIK